MKQDILHSKHRIKIPKRYFTFSIIVALLFSIFVYITIRSTFVTRYKNSITNNDDILIVENGFSVLFPIQISPGDNLGILFDDHSTHGHGNSLIWYHWKLYKRNIYSINKIIAASGRKVKDSKDFLNIVNDVLKLRYPGYLATSDEFKIISTESDRFDITKRVIDLNKCCKSEDGKGWCDEGIPISTIHYTGDIYEGHIFIFKRPFCIEEFYIKYDNRMPKIDIKEIGYYCRVMPFAE